MGQLQQFMSTALADRRISDEETAQLRELLHADGRLDLDDVRVLVEIYCQAEERTASFEALFFATLEQVFLEDGEIKPSEQFYLLKMLYCDREIHEPELAFLRRLRQNAVRRSREFDELYDTAMKCHPTDWCTGGR